MRWGRPVFGGFRLRYLLFVAMAGIALLPAFAALNWLQASADQAARHVAAEPLHESVETLSKSIEKRVVDLSMLLQPNSELPTNVSKASVTVVTEQFRLPENWVAPSIVSLQSVDEQARSALWFFGSDDTEASALRLPLDFFSGLLAALPSQADTSFVLLDQNEMVLAASTVAANAPQFNEPAAKSCEGVTAGNPRFIRLVQTEVRGLIVCDTNPQTAVTIAAWAPISALPLSEAKVGLGAKLLVYLAVLVSVALAWFAADKISGAFEGIVTNRRIQRQQGTRRRWFSLNPAEARELDSLISNIETQRDNATQALLSRDEQDQVTGLLSRVQFEQAMNILATIHSKGGSAEVWVIVVGIANLEVLNSRYGKERLNECLQLVGQQLKTEFSSQYVARLSGSRFVVLLESSGDPKSIIKLSNSCLKNLRDNASPDAKDGRLKVSAGISGLEQAGGEPDACLRSAQIAYRSTLDPRSKATVLFSPDMHAAQRRKQLVLEKLPAALASGELEIHYQPKVCLKTGAVKSVEALLRWPIMHTDFDISVPEIIEVAEDNSLLHKLDAWLIETILNDTKNIAGTARKPLRVALNVSPKRLTRKGIVLDIERAKEAGLDISRLDVEVTETAILEDIEESVAAMMRLQALGLDIHIDDFGSGYTSLAYLKRLPASILKIDKMFVSALTEDDKSQAVVAAIIDLAKAFNLETVAEGVETQTEAKLLKAEGCDYVQGYYFSRPLPLASLKQWLQEGKGARLV